MSLFLILVNYIAALMGVQLLRGDMAGDLGVNFGNVFNAFTGVYQIFSSEDWTSVLYDATEAAKEVKQEIVVATFLAVWMLFANCESFDL